MPSELDLPAAAVGDDVMCGRHLVLRKSDASSRPTYGNGNCSAWSAQIARTELDLELKLLLADETVH